MKRSVSGYCFMVPSKEATGVTRKNAPKEK